MTESAGTIRRILLALEAGGALPEDVDAVVALAERLRAEIFGLIVEDVNLLRSAALPFVHQVNLLTGRPEPFEVEWIEQQMHDAATEVETRLRRAAGARHIRWSVRVVRGPVVEQVLAAAEDGDLLVIETPPSPLQSAGNAPASQTVRRASRPVLVLRPGVRLVGRPVLVVFDGSEDSVTALRLAALLASDGETVVEIALLAPSHEQREALEQTAREALTGFRGTLRLHRLTAADPRLACALARRLDSAILFVGAQNEMLRERGLSELLEVLQCPVWVVR